MTLALCLLIPSVGALLMALTIARRPPFQRAGRTLLLAVAGFGIATIIFGLSTSFWLSLAMLFLLGALDNISVVVRHTLIMIQTPDEMRGRVAAVNSVFIGASNELGAFESGVAARAFGLPWSIAGGGAITMLIAASFWFWFPTVRGIDSFADVDQGDPKQLGSSPARHV